jgi:hypothetical protein
MRLPRLALLFCSIVLISVIPLLAQTSDFPRVEVFGGYQFVNGDAGPLQETADVITDFYDLPRLDIGNRFNAHGWDGSVQVNATSWLSGIFDVSGAYGKKEIDLLPLLVAGGYDTTGIGSAVARADLDDYSFMGGPQITIRNNKSFQPFVRALFGVVHGKEADNIYVNDSLSTATLSMTTPVSRSQLEAALMLQLLRTTQ